MVKKYNCPDCGADMAYSPEKGKLLCSHCGHEDIVLMDAPGDFEGESVFEYHCPNCGSVLVTGEKTSSVTCEYCEAPLVLSDRLSGVYKPQKIIPFKIGKKGAEEAFRKWCHNGWFVPKMFLSQSNINKMKGMYVPYWLFNMHAQATVDGTATTVHVSRRGDMEYTTTRYFQVHRDGEMDFANVPYDASEKMPDTEMAKLEPYHFDECEYFAMPYLAGFDSEQYDYSDRQLLPAVEQRLKEGAVGRLRQTFPMYTTVSLPVQNVDFQSMGNEYTLLPVWTLSTMYRGQEYKFMMNGQTGQVVGCAPVSFPKVALLGSAVSVLLFIILMIVG